MIPKVNFRLQCEIADLLPASNPKIRIYIMITLICNDVIRNFFVYKYCSVSCPVVITSIAGKYTTRKRQRVKAVIKSKVLLKSSTAKMDRLS